MNMTLNNINHTFSVTNEKGESVQISVIYDVSKAPESAVKQWIAADRTIAFQRTLKKLSAAEIKSFNGKTIVYDGSRTKVNIDPETAMVEMLKAMDKNAQEQYLKDLIAKASK